MAWMWWLAAPVMCTAAGAVILGWRDRRAFSRRGLDPIAEHQALLSALAELAPPAHQIAPMSDR